MKTLGGFVAGGVAVIILSLGALQARTWTSAADASKKVEGEFVSSDGTNVEIKLATGKTIKTLLTFFSKEDQDFVAAQLKPAASVEPGAPTPAAKAEPPKPGDLEPITFEVWKIRDCCSKAERMYEEAIADVEGVRIEFGENSLKHKIFTMDAETKVAAREALNKMFEAGLYGGSTSREVKFPAARINAKGDMTATGVVFCCNKGVEALEKAVMRSRGAVEGEKGVTEHTIKKSKDTFEIKGTATASEILRHSREEGFNFNLAPYAPPAEEKK